MAASRFIPSQLYRLTVSDRGVGIPEQERDQIFERYHRVSAGPWGLGLGLHICRNIVRGHGGEIHAEPNAGGGTRMVVTLPTGAPA